MLAAHPDYVREHPIATKRVLRAVIKAADFCAAQPEQAAQRMVDGRFTARYDFALQALKVGAVLVAQGDLAGGLAAYRESLDIARTLSAKDPSNTQWRRDLSIGLNGLGDLLQGQGDLTGALSAYRESLDIRRALAATDPSNTQWRRDLSVSLTKVGNVLASQGDLTTAVATHRERVDFARELAAKDPGNTKCPGNPDALGTERTIAVDPAEHERIGAMQYRETLPLADKEVVLTFDDGPLLPYTARILETLASECVKATFFMIGRQARAHPEWVSRVYNEGHTVASHSQNHPRIFTRLPVAKGEAEIEDGISSITAALGDPKAFAPFFRFPGLGRSEAIEAYLASRGIMAWSADLVADDWRRINAQEIMARALVRLEQRGKGVLLLHDIHPATVLALPALLRELKARGYRIVHVVPAGPDRPKSVTEPDSWALHKPKPSGWPRAIEPGTPPALLVPSLNHYDSGKTSQRGRTGRSRGARKHTRGRGHRFALRRGPWRSSR